MKKISYIDLFSGAGGLSLGLYNAGLRGVFAVEKNADAFSTLKHNLIDNKKHFDWPNWLPIKNHDIKELLDNYHTQLQALKGKVDIIVGGPPCQGFSMAGKRDHSDARNTMVHYYLDMVKIIEPKYVFFENVSGFTVKFKNFDDLSIPYSEFVKNELIKMNYSVNDSAVNMSDFGVPQKRKRFILVASKNKLADVFFEKLKESSGLYLTKLGLTSSNTVSDAISDLLQVNGTIQCTDSIRKFQCGLYSDIESSYQKVMRVGNPTAPNSHRFPHHSKEIVTLHESLQNLGIIGKRICPKDNLVPDLKRRGVTLLNAEGQAPTITSIPDELVHYIEPRILTPREMARIQSFPDWYEFQGKYTTGGMLRRVDVPRYTQIANAVPPLFAAQVGQVFKTYVSKTVGEIN